MAKAMITADNQTVSVPAPEEKKPGTRVRIILPKLDESSDGVTVDQYEHVSISNGKGDNFIRIKRGEYVDVTPEVFTLLKQRYPNI